MQKKGKIINIGTRRLDEIIDSMEKYSFEADRYEIIDLRDSYEYKRSHIKWAKNINGENLKMSITNEEKHRVLYCDSGANSMHYAKILASRGMMVYNLLNGFESYKGKYLIKPNIR